MIDTLISSISEKSLSNFIRSRNSTFIEYKEDLSYLINDFDQFDNLSKLGEIEYDNTDVLLVFSCAYKGLLSTRSARKMQFEIAKKALKEDFKDGSVFVFYDEIGNFRFSFIRKNYGDKEQKYSNWKRFTYFVDPVSQTNRTFIDRIGTCNFDSLENIQNAFSVEPISKEFFDGYKAQYEKFCAFMQTDKKMQYNFREFLTDGTNKAVRDYVKKMLGRIVFLHFLQKKGWMGVPKDTKCWTGGDTNFIDNLFNNSSKEQKDNFLDEVLEPMFFESLNKRRHNDWHDTKTSIGIVKIPYLNGGLFEPDSIDKPDSTFPSNYFKELFQFFNQFNFTIDENDPNDAEVGVDPEMLGHIFENLLEDNKDKGAFYTPKEIVHYMCQESLIEYLCTALSVENTDKKSHIEVLVKYHVIDEKLHSRISEINAVLDKVKICDPAIGSGAFPMGLLHEIFAIKQVLWLFEHNELESFPASEVKLNIIQNSIYGVDIEKGAVDIARLRFWLSLVVDEEVPKPLPNLDYKIVCGDSLISRFPLDLPINEVFAEYNKGKSQKFTLEDYKFMISDYLNVHEGKEIFRNKIEEIKGAFRNVLSKGDLIKRKKKESEVIEYESVGIFGERKADNDIVGYEKVKSELKSLLQAEKEIFENKIYNNSIEWRFEFPSLLDEDGNFLGFDIVIGNPPYITYHGRRRILISNDKMDYFRQNYLSAINAKKNGGKFNAAMFFLEKPFFIGNKNSVCCFITDISFFEHFYMDLKKLLIQKTIIHKVISGLTSFENVGSGQLILLYQKNENQNENENNKILYSNQGLNSEINFVVQEKLNNESNKFQFYIPNDLTDDLIQKIENKSKPLDYYFPKKLIRTGESIGVKETGFVLNSIDINDKVEIYEYLEGSKSIPNRYCNPTPTRYFRYDVNLLNKRNEKYRAEAIANNRISPKVLGIGDKLSFDNPKILIRQSANHLCCTYTNLKYVYNRSMYSISNKNSSGESNVNLFYILGLLNSNLLTYYAIKKRIIRMDPGKQPQIRLEDLKSLPVKLSSQETEEKIIKLVISRLNNDEPDIIKEIETGINILVYKLYNLHYEEVLKIDPDIYLNVNKLDYEVITLD